MGSHGNALAASADGGPRGTAARVRIGTGSRGRDSGAVSDAAAGLGPGSRERAKGGEGWDRDGWSRTRQRWGVDGAVVFELPWASSRRDRPGAEGSLARRLRSGSPSSFR